MEIKIEDFLCADFKTAAMIARIWAKNGRVESRRISAGKVAFVITKIEMKRGAPDSLEFYLVDAHRLSDDVTESMKTDRDMKITFTNRPPLRWD